MPEQFNGKGLVQLVASLPNQRVDPTAAGHPSR